MSKKCGKCSKTVYPTEELKCLDKIWHKACFKCQVCNMTLNMKNYKGYDKFPYCNAHYPTTKHTAVADTPESRRIAQNTKIQSNIKYHEQFEKEKGTKISVVDDPETERLKKNTQVVSNVVYHNTLRHKEEQESNRPMEKLENNAARNRKAPGSITEYNPPVASSHAASRSQPTPVYNSKGEDFAQQQSRRQIGSIADYDPMMANPPQQNYQQSQARSPALFTPTPYSPPGQFSSKERQISSVSGYNPPSNVGRPASYDQRSNMGQPQTYDQRSNAGRPQTYDPRSNMSPSYGQAQSYQYSQSQPAQPSSLYTPFRPQAESSGTENSTKHEEERESYPDDDDKLAESIQILDDLEKSLNGDENTENDSVQNKDNDIAEAPTEAPPPGQFMTTYPVPSQDVEDNQQKYEESYPPEPQADVSQSRYSASYPSQPPEPATDGGFRTSYPSQPSPPSQPPEEDTVVGNGFRTTYPTEPEPAPQPVKQSRGMVSQAMYDYSAADDDEVSFAENDVIVQCEPVDDGWMYGTVERTGQRGMLPSNYVQRIN